MSQGSRYEFLLVARRRYAGRGRQARGRLLDEVCAICGVSRKHAIKLMGGQVGLKRPGTRVARSRRVSTGFCAELIEARTLRGQVGSRFLQHC